MRRRGEDRVVIAVTLLISCGLAALTLGAITPEIACVAGVGVGLLCSDHGLARVLGPLPEERQSER